MNASPQPKPKRANPSPPPSLLLSSTRSCKRFHDFTERMILLRGGGHCACMRSNPSRNTLLRRSSTRNHTDPPNRAGSTIHRPGHKSSTDSEPSRAPVLPPQQEESHSLRAVRPAAASRLLVRRRPMRTDDPSNLTGNSDDTPAALSRPAPPSAAITPRRTRPARRHTALSLRAPSTSTTATAPPSSTAGSKEERPPSQSQAKYKPGAHATSSGTIPAPTLFLPSARTPTLGTGRGEARRRTETAKGSSPHFTPPDNENNHSGRRATTPSSSDTTTSPPRIPPPPPFTHILTNMHNGPMNPHQLTRTQRNNTAEHQVSNAPPGAPYPQPYLSGTSGTHALSNVYQRTSARRSDRNSTTGALNHLQF